MFHKILIPHDGSAVAGAVFTVARTVAEQHGQRAEAGRVRADATQAYSRAWDTSAVSKLRALRIHAERVIAGREQPRPQHPLLAVLGRFTPERTA